MIEPKNKPFHSSLFRLKHNAKDTKVEPTRDPPKDLDAELSEQKIRSKQN